MKKRLFLGTWLGLLLAGIGPAAAQAGPSLQHSRELFKAGAIAYGAGDYLAAIQALEGAYNLTPLPAIAFSLAQAARKQYFVTHDREYLTRAIALYRRYVEQAPNGSRRAEALEALSQLEPLAISVTLQSGSETPSRNAASRTRLMITADRPFAWVSLDGKKPVPSPLIREVTPGSHVVEVTAVGYHSVQRPIAAIEGEFIPIDVTLTERPATLVIRAPSDAQILLDGVLAGRGGSAMKLETPSGVHRIEVLQAGHRPWSRTVQLKPAQSFEVSSHLQVTSQRLVSRVFFVAGGAAVGGALILGAFAKRAENSAEEYLVRQARANVTADELGEYNASVQQRNLRRAAAITALSVGGALFVSGFLLYEFDHPSGLGYERRNAAANAPTAVSAQKLQVRLYPQCFEVWSACARMVF